MDRRDFFKAAGFAGLSLATPFGTSVARAQTGDPYDGPLYVLVNAAGGWDPTSFCDPKGAASETDTDPMNRAYLQSEIQQAGNIRYAPMANNQAFFEKYAARMLVINGIDVATNGHDSGLRHMWSGRLTEGYPALGAMLAGQLAPTKPLSFISNGGYDTTFGLVAPTRTGDSGALTRIAYPTRHDETWEESEYYSPSTRFRLRSAMQARLQRQRAAQQLPRLQRAMDTLFVARLGEQDIRRITEHLPRDLDGSNNLMKRQAQVALASYKAGVTVACNLYSDGFDSHADHDSRQADALILLTDGLDFLWQEAERQGVANRLVVIVGSDMGRTPGYNSDNGKDHWSVTSMILMGRGIPGNRVIGYTDPRHGPLKVNPTTLAQDDSGTRITPAHIHRALRQLAGLSGGELDKRYPVSDTLLPLFG